MSIMKTLETIEAFRQRSGPFRRQVSIQRDGCDFVVMSQPDKIVVFRHSTAQELRKVCHQLRWEIVSDTTPGLEPASW
jgi:hypothetical protein